MTFSSPTGYSSPASNVTGYKTRSVSNFTPEMQQLFDKLLGGLNTGGGPGNGLDYLSKLASGQQGGFEQEEAPAYEAYNRGLAQQANRYAGLGALGSSSFQNLASSGAQELGMNLASRRGELQRNAIEKLLGYSTQLLAQKPYDYGFEDEGPSTLQKLLGLLGRGAGSFIGSIGSPVGTAAGEYLGGAVTDYLTKKFGSRGNLNPKPKGVA